MIKVYDDGIFKIELTEDDGDFILQQEGNTVGRYSTLTGAKDAIKRRETIKQKVGKIAPYPVLNREGGECKITSLSRSRYGSLEAWITQGKKRGKEHLSYYYQDTPAMREIFKQLKELHTQQTTLAKKLVRVSDADVLKHFKLEPKDVENDS